MKFGSFMIVFLFLLTGAGSTFSAEKEKQTKQAEISPEDAKVVAELETLQLMDITKDMEMLKDLNCLTEVQKDETKTN